MCPKEMCFNAELSIVPNCKKHTAMIKLQMNKLGLFILMLLAIPQITVCQNGEKEYNIGYKSNVYRDYSRDDNLLNKEQNLRNSINNYRVVTISMWYPSNITESDEKVKFGNFLPTIELNEKKDYNVKDSIISPADKFADYYNISKAHFSSLINYTTQSYLNSKHLDEKYPLVIYIPGMNGFSFENHMLCEEIAKQGYVVISFNSKGSDKRWMEPNTIDYENQIRDVQFLIAETNNLSFVDNSKICLVGHSIGGYVNILTKIRDNRISSLVSLDGSIVHDLNRYKEFVYNDLNKVNCPVLSISTQDFNKARIYLDSMSHADRYYCKTLTFNHKDFKSITYLLQTSVDSVKFKAYQKLNNLIVLFINKVNNNKKQGGFDELSNNLSNSGLVTTSYLPSIPDFSDFKFMVYNANFDNMIRVYKNTVKQHPSFELSKNELYDWGNSLRYYGYFSQAIQVYQLLIDLYPDYISGYNGMARTLLLQDDNKEAIKVYKLALKIDPNNESIKRKLNKMTTEKSN
ncbi:prolyl oligopeptidase family serine peptidase [Maribellus comscasis]|uniref:Prolyl oligopeptidase family serine peptidase n=1 Tax=Maribellus comscasis TaxID=2681766 RepID=A0A6I6JP60_9BACT|nr:prolyl oligopeptidase family serine peptidase [Maribellus comscasis]QGY42848.1 prolyl oligopeptidase family serine peptidase [Maribellus comscasis]